MDVLMIREAQGLALRVSRAVDAAGPGLPCAPSLVAAEFMRMLLKKHLGADAELVMGYVAEKEGHRTHFWLRVPLAADEPQAFEARDPATGEARGGPAVGEARLAPNCKLTIDAAQAGKPKLTLHEDRPPGPSLDSATDIQSRASYARCARGDFWAEVAAVHGKAARGRLLRVYSNL